MACCWITDIHSSTRLGSVTRVKTLTIDRIYNNIIVIGCSYTFNGTNNMWYCLDLLLCELYEEETYNLVIYSSAGTTIVLENNSYWQDITYYNNIIIWSWNSILFLFWGRMTIKTIPGNYITTIISNTYYRFVLQSLDTCDYNWQVVNAIVPSEYILVYFNII